MFKKLEIRFNEFATVAGDNENLYVYLSDVDSEPMRERFGPEKVVCTGMKVNVRGQTFYLTSTKGKRFKMAAGTLQGGRYLLRETPLGSPVAALNWTHAKNEVFISNIFVRIDFREKGLASSLVEMARKDFNQLKVDSNMTLRGAKFFGYSPVTKVSNLRLS